MAKTKKKTHKKREMGKKPEMHMEEEIHIEVPHGKKVRKKLPLSDKAEDKMEKVLSEFEHGTLHSSSKKGPKVKSRKQALAIGMSEERKAKKKGKKKKK
jgi:hypothetical protein